LKLKNLAWLVGGVSAGMLLYGALVEAEKLVVRKHALKLKRWPKALDGYKIGLIADFHLRDRHTVDLTRRAVESVIAEEPDVIVIAGDFVGYWKPESPRLIGEALQALSTYAGKIIAVPGNHDYWSGDASLLEPICEELGITLLRNQSLQQGGVHWLGIDSFNARRSDLSAAISDLESRIADFGEPTIVVWHEPDAVRHLPPIFDLMLSGHSHGGQFVFPGGFIPMKTKNGSKHIGGYYPNAKTPLFVTRGIGTTGPPSRFLCPPEIVLITLTSSGGS
jgi:predicted MPP superfamily phosphohydrolase